MSWLSQIFGGNAHNPADAAMPYMQGMRNDYTSPDAYNQISGQYQQSPGYQFKLQQALEAMNHAQASGGMLGSNQHQQESGMLANNIANQDFQDYFKNRMGLGQDMAGITGAQGQLAYQGDMFKNQQQSNKMNGILGLLGTLGGSYLGAPRFYNNGNDSSGGGSHWFGG